MVVRTWNLFHGNTLPRGKRSHLRRMIDLAVEDRPGVLCLQELPVWVLGKLEDWSGMQSYGAVARRALLPGFLARLVTGLNSGFFRSALTGQANAILLAPSLAVADHQVLPLSSPEDRVCQAVRLESGVVVANLHGSGNRRGIPAEEAARLLELVESFDCPRVVIAGDFNSKPRLEGFSGPGPGIDHVLVRGFPARPIVVWPIERRTVEGRVLSDHPPVEMRLDL